MSFFGLGPKPPHRDPNGQYLLDQFNARRKARGLTEAARAALLPDATQQQKDQAGLRPGPVPQPDPGGGGGPDLGGTDPPDPIADLQAAYDAAGSAGIRGRKRAAAGSRRTLVNTPNAATPVLKRRTLLGA